MTGTGVSIGVVRREEEMLNNDGGYEWVDELIKEEKLNGKEKEKGKGRGGRKEKQSTE